MGSRGESNGRTLRSNSRCGPRRRQHQDDEESNLEQPSGEDDSAHDQTGSLITNDRDSSQPSDESSGLGGLHNEEGQSKDAKIRVLEMMVQEKQAEIEELNKKVQTKDAEIKTWKAMYDIEIKESQQSCESLQKMRSDLESDRKIAEVLRNKIMSRDKQMKKLQKRIEAAEARTEEANRKANRHAQLSAEMKRMEKLRADEDKAKIHTEDNFGKLKIFQQDQVTDRGFFIFNGSPLLKMFKDGENSVALNSLIEVSNESSVLLMSRVALFQIVTSENLHLKLMGGAKGDFRLDCLPQGTQVQAYVGIMCTLQEVPFALQELLDLLNKRQRTYTIADLGSHLTLVLSHKMTNGSKKKHGFPDRKVYVAHSKKHDHIADQDVEFTGLTSDDGKSSAKVKLSDIEKLQFQIQRYISTNNEKIETTEKIKECQQNIVSLEARIQAPEEQEREQSSSGINTEREHA